MANFFFGGISGYNSFYPNEIKVDTNQFKIELTRFLVNGNVYPSLSLNEQNKRLEFDYSQNNFDIAFSAMDFYHPQKIKYAYWLKGDDTKWNQLEYNHELHLGNLTNGKYTLLVKCTSADGVWTGPVTLLTFTIHPPFWKTIGFNILVVAVIGLLVFLIVKYVLTQKFKLKIAEEKRESELLTMRQRISRDMHDEIGSGLSRIALLSQTIQQHKKNDYSEQTLIKLKNISQQLGGQLAEMIWSVDPVNDRLDNFLAYLRYYASELLEENNIECEISFSEIIPAKNIEPEWRRNIFSITKEALNNAIKYAEAKSMQLKFELANDGSFYYEIKDDGKGFDVNKTRVFGKGIQSMKQRAHESDCMIEIISSSLNGTCISLSGKIKYYENSIA